MKLIDIPVTELKRALKKLSFVNSAKFTIDPQTGTIVGTDNDIVIAVLSLDLVDKDDANFISVPSKQFSSAFSGLSGKISIKTSGNVLVVESGKSTRLELPIAAGSKPALPASPKSYHKIPLKSIAPLISFAATVAEKNTEFDFSGSVLLTSTNGTIQAAGTDKKRLAIAVGSASLPDLRMLIPLKAAQAIRELEGENISIAETDRALFFQSENIMIVSRKLVDKFPNYDSIIPKTFNVEAQINATEMRDLLKRIAPIASNRDYPMSFTIDDQILKIKAGDAEGNAYDELRIITTKPDPLDSETASFKASASFKHLTDFFGVVNGSVFFGGVDSKTPLWFASGNYKLLTATF